MILRKAPVSLFVLLSVLLFASTGAEAGMAFRLEKEVPQSAVKGVNPITVNIFDSKTAASPVATQNFSVGELMVSLLETMSGAPQYRVRMDFTETDALTMGMDLYWEFSLGGSMMGKREKVPQSAMALFAAEAAVADTSGHATTAGDADTIDGQHAAAFAQTGHTHDGSDIVSGAVAVTRGGTGATSAAGARTNLGDLARQSDLTALQEQIGIQLPAGRAPAATTISTITTQYVQNPINPSVTIGADGLPIVAFFDMTYDNVMVAHCSDPACTSSALSTVDSTGVLGWFQSLAIGSDGLPVISYYDYTNTALKVAHCNSATSCFSNTQTVVDNTNVQGQYSSIAIGVDGFPVISYYDATNTALKFVHCEDLACTSSTIVFVDNSAAVGEHTSVAIGSDGLPIISYFDATNFDLKVAHCNDLTCTAPDVFTVASAGNVGRYNSIAIGDDGLAFISYSGGAEFAHCDDLTCSTRTLSTLASAGVYTSVAIGTDGLPIISSYDNPSQSLMAIHCNDLLCTNSSTVTVDDSYWVGIGTSVTIGTDGLPIIVYRDENNRILKAAKASNRYFLPYWSRR